MKKFLILFFSSAVLCQGAESSKTEIPQSAEVVSSTLTSVVPEPSTALLTIMAGALGALRRRRS